MDSQNENSLQINDEGYTNLDALEPCAEFAKMCREKGIYSRVYECFIGDGKQLDIPDSELRIDS